MLLKHVLHKMTISWLVSLISRSSAAEKFLWGSFVCKWCKWIIRLVVVESLLVVFPAIKMCFWQIKLLFLENVSLLSDYHVAENNKFDLNSLNREQLYPTNYVLNHFVEYIFVEKTTAAWTFWIFKQIHNVTITFYILLWFRGVDDVEERRQFADVFNMNVSSLCPTHPHTAVETQRRGNWTFVV